MPEPTALTSEKEPTRQITEQDVDLIIGWQRQSIRYYLIFAIGLVAVGLILLTIIFIVFGRTLSDALKSLFGIGCGFISSLSAFQIREILDRTRSVHALTLCKAHLGSPDAALRKRYEDLAWKSLEKMTLG